MKKFNNNATEKLYNVVMSNTKKVGKKEYADIPVELLFADELFQRVGSSSKRKIKELADKWNPDKMDALKVVPHPEEKRFSVVDGYHRLSAAIIIGQPSLECEIIMGLSTVPSKRLIQEATLFATQNEEVDTLSPVECHKANVLRGVSENIIVEELINKYHINLKTNPSHGKVQMGQLAGFTMALSVARVSGKATLNDVFDILCQSRWNLSTSGLGSNAIHVVYNLLRLHPEHKEAVRQSLVHIFEGIEPNGLFYKAYAKYPARKERERILLYAEDLVCEELGIARVYYGGSVSDVLKRIA